MKICIDAGHGGTDPGAIGAGPFRLDEKTFNLALALLLESELSTRGHAVLMTRRVDRTLSLRARASFANQFGADFFVSIHANAALDPAVEGMEVFHFPGSPTGRQAAQSVLRSMMNTFGDHRDRGVKEANFTVLRLTHMPAVLVECEFLTCPQQLPFLADPTEQVKLARAIADGVTDALA
jgi:N-acetylmuramoyl-L-alanine amidase